MKVSEAVIQLESESESENALLKLERQELRGQLKALRQGNVVLVRKDGFYQIKTLAPPYAHGNYYSERELLPQYMEDVRPFADCGASYRTIHYHNIGRKDDCGRWIFEEQ